MEKITITKTVEAWQWNGEEKDLPEGFHLCKPEVHYSADRSCVYFTYAGLRSAHWIGTQKLEEKPHSGGFDGAIMVTPKEGKPYYRKVYPFAMYSIKSEASIKSDHRAKFINTNLPDEMEAFVDYAMLEGWGGKSTSGDLMMPPCIEFRETDGGLGRGYRPHYIKPNEWLVIDDDKIIVMSTEQVEKLRG